MSADEVLNFALDRQNKHRIKAVANSVPFVRNWKIYDLSLNSKGMDEDEEYAYNEDLREMIRRGNTILYDESDGYTCYCRKGLKKFFDISMDWLDDNKKYEYKSNKFSRDCDELKNVILKPVENAF